MLNRNKTKQKKACLVLNCPPGGLLLTQPKHLPDAYRVLMALIQSFSKTLGLGVASTIENSDLGTHLSLHPHFLLAVPFRYKTLPLPVSCHKDSNL